MSVELRWDNEYESSSKETKAGYWKIRFENIAFNFVYAYVCERLCSCVCPCLWRPAALDPLGLQLQGLVSFLMCILRAELEFSRRTVSALNCSVVFPAPFKIMVLCIFDVSFEQCLDMLWAISPNAEKATNHLCSR